jgi:hypothetical protein
MSSTCSFSQIGAKALRLCKTGSLRTTARSLTSASTPKWSSATAQPVIASRATIIPNHKQSRTICNSSATMDAAIDTTNPLLTVSDILITTMTNLSDWRFSLDLLN